MRQVTIYTDGSAKSTGGAGGFGAVLIYGSKEKELSGGYRWTNHNRMELMGAIEALKALKEPCAVNLWGDSEYVINNMAEARAERWSRYGWKTKSGVVPNADLWAILLQAAARHEIAWGWIKGHKTYLDTLPEDERRHYLYNHRCDKLAGAAALNVKETGMFTIDLPYEQLKGYKPPMD
jgi:ribonuclease HI